MEVRRTKPMDGRAVNVRGVSRAQAATGAAPAQPVVDTASVLGLSEGELTPKVRAAILALMQEVDHLRTELQRSQSRIAYLEKLADEDTLVNALNRRAFVRELSRTIAYSQRYGTQSSLLFFDIDNMKEINDSFGHGVGDAVLATIADILARNVRESDVVGRLGGDEFGVILASADEKTAREKAAGLAVEIKDQGFSWQGERVPFTVSAGSYTLPGGPAAAGTDAAAALREADRAMYANKQNRPSGREDGSSGKS